MKAEYLYGCALITLSIVIIMVLALIRNKNKKIVEETEITIPELVLHEDDEVIISIEFDDEEVGDITLRDGESEMEAVV